MAAYLEKLNPDQRAAVEHGVAGDDARPLLIIAGAGTGKTNTLAHRVAHLVMSGADPARVLLLTFSRRAALEMIRRTQRILGAMSATGTTNAISQSIRLPWSGTFHSIANRLI